MIALGVHASGARDRYTVGFVALEDEQLVEQYEFGAPESTAGRALHELFGRAAGMVEHRAPDVVVVWGVEVFRGKYSPALGRARHAEGVVLAAAASKGVEAELLQRATIGGMLGLGGSPSADRVIEEATSLVNGAVEGGELPYAAAAAMAAVRRAA